MHAPFNSHIKRSHRAINTYIWRTLRKEISLLFVRKIYAIYFKSNLQKILMYILCAVYHNLRCWKYILWAAFGLHKSNQGQVPFLTENSDGFTGV